MKKHLLTAISICFSVICHSQAINLEVRAYAQGFYAPGSGLLLAVADPVNHPLMCDTASIVIIDSLTGQSVFCDRSPISVQGYGYSSVPSILSGGNYLVGVRFRNTIHLVSKNTIAFDSTFISVDLSIPSNVCCDFDSSLGVALAYSGDLNSDGAVDVIDLTIMDNDITQGLTGYVVTDLNGDSRVDTFDLQLLVNNVNLFLFDNYGGLCLTTGVNSHPNNPLDVLIYPNSFRNSFRLSFSHVVPEATLGLYDIFGREHYFTVLYNTESADINLPDLAPGVYFARISEGRNRFSLRMVSY